MDWKSALSMQCKGMLNVVLYPLSDLALLAGIRVPVAMCILVSSALLASCDAPLSAKP